MSDRVKKWTEGDWSASGYLVYGDVGNVPLTVATTRMERWKSKRPIAESQANATLFSAAPIMVDVLETIVRRLMADIEDGSRPDQWSMQALVDKAESALSKAYGETNN